MFIFRLKNIYLFVFLFSFLYKNVSSFLPFNTRFLEYIEVTNNVHGFDLKPKFRVK